MLSLLGNLRLAVGCWALFIGILLLSAPSAELASGTMPRWWGVIVGGAGLAITLREFALMLALFVRAKSDD